MHFLAYESRARIIVWFEMWIFIKNQASRKEGTENSLGRKCLIGRRCRLCYELFPIYVSFQTAYRMHIFAVCTDRRRRTPQREPDKRGRASFHNCSASSPISWSWEYGLSSVYTQTHVKRARTFARSPRGSFGAGLGAQAIFQKYIGAGKLTQTLAVTYDACAAATT